jgi:undecaprenyl-diphosphatase
MKHDSYWQRQLLETARDVSAFGSALFVVCLCMIMALSDRTAAASLAIGLAVVEACGHAIKFLFHRNRPEAQPYGNTLERLDAASFPSIHTARSAMISVVAGTVWGWFPMWVGIAVLVGISRIVLKRHHPGDVLAGGILGLAAGWLVRLML